MHNPKHLHTTVDIRKIPINQLIWNDIMKRRRKTRYIYYQIKRMNITQIDNLIIELKSIKCLLEKKNESHISKAYKSLCRKMEIPYYFALQKTRKPKVSLPRMVICYILNSYYGFMHEEIGAFFELNHSLVAHSKKRFNQIIETKDRLYIPELHCSIYEFSFKIKQEAKKIIK